MIPRTMHRVWLGEKDIPAEYDAYWHRFEELNVGWTFKTWREDDLRGLRNRSLFRSVKTLSEKSDVARFEILATQGGVYVDTDVEPIRAWPDDVLTCGAFAGWEYGTKLGTAVLGCAPGHAAFRALVDQLPGWAARHADQPPDRKTGPLFLTSCWWKRRDVMRFARHWFYPYGWFEPEKRGGPYPPETVVAHHWAHSWRESS